jgi:hypothetical protein
MEGVSTWHDLPGAANALDHAAGEPRGPARPGGEAAAARTRAAAAAADAGADGELRLEGHGLTECPGLEVGAQRRGRGLHGVEGGAGCGSRRVNAPAQPAANPHAPPRQGASPRVLSLRRNALAAAPALGPGAAARLAVLDISRNRVADLGPAAACAGLRALLAGRNLIADLSPLRVGEPPRDRLQGDAAGKQGRRTPPWAGWTGPPERPPRATPQGLSRLELLDISHNRVASLDGVLSLRRLAMLRAGGNPVAALPCLTGLTALTELSLDSCPLESLTCGGTSLLSPADAGGGCCSLPAGLRRLGLRRCALPAAAALAPLAVGTPGLAHLAVEGNPFTRPGALAPGEGHRPVALQHCPLALRALDGDAVTPEERVLMLVAARRREARRLRGQGGALQVAPGGSNCTASAAGGEGGRPTADAAAASAAAAAAEQMPATGEDAGANSLLDSAEAGAPLEALLGTSVAEVASKTAQQRPPPRQLGAAAAVAEGRPAAPTETQRGSLTASPWERPWDYEAIGRAELEEEYLRAGGLAPGLRWVWGC